MGSTPRRNLSPRIEQFEDEIDEAKPVRNDKCPVDGCDSTGHINGIKEKHFLAESCPFFHNMTKEGFQIDFVRSLLNRLLVAKKDQSVWVVSGKMKTPTRVGSMIHIDYESASKRIKTEWFDLLIIKMDIENLSKRYHFDIDEWNYKEWF